MKHTGNPYGYMDFDNEAFEKWENETHIPAEVMDMVNFIADKIGVGHFEEVTIPLTSVYGVTYGWGKGLTISHCTSSYADGPSPDYSDVFLGWIKGLGFSMQNSYGDNGLDSETNWHDTFWHYDFLYGGIGTFYRDMHTVFVPYDEDDEDAYTHYLEWEEEREYLEY